MNEKREIAVLCMCLKQLGYELTSYTNKEFNFDKPNSPFHIQITKNEVIRN